MKTNTCNALVHLLACALQEEPWFVHGCARGEYATFIDGLYTQEGALLQPIAPIEHPLDVVEANGRSRARWICSHAR
jgi:hypothetical protein